MTAKGIQTPSAGVEAAPASHRIAAAQRVPAWSTTNEVAYITMQAVEISAVEVLKKSPFIAFRVIKQPTIVAALKTFVLLTVYLVVSITVMMALEPEWTAIDSAYFAMMTMSTVGCASLDHDLSLTQTCKMPTDDSLTCVRVCSIEFSRLQMATSRRAAAARARLPSS